jgi:hypothetical protein
MFFMLARAYSVTLLDQKLVQGVVTELNTGFSESNASVSNRTFDSRTFTRLSNATSPHAYSTLLAFTTCFGRPDDNSRLLNPVTGNLQLSVDYQFESACKKHNGNDQNLRIGEWRMYDPFAHLARLKGTRFTDNGKRIWQLPTLNEAARSYRLDKTNL